MHIYASDHFVLPLPAGHRFPMEKYSRLRARLMDSGLFGADDFHVPAAASDTEILRAHDAAYLQRMVRGSLAKEEIRRCAGTQFDPTLAEAFLRIDDSEWADIRNRVEEMAKAESARPADFVPREERAKAGVQVGNGA